MYNLNGQELRDLSILESKFLDSDGEVKNVVTLEDYFKLVRLRGLYLKQTELYYASWN
jgi:hypothetical protein